MLAGDAVLLADGGKVHAAPQPMNGRPGIVVTSGTVIQVFAFASESAAITNVYIVMNPDKLSRLSTAPRLPQAADDVSAELARVAVGSPLNAVVELAGPERMSIAGFVGRFMAVNGDKRKVVADPQALYAGAVMGELGIAPGTYPPGTDDV